MLLLLFDTLLQQHRCLRFSEDVAIMSAEVYNLWPNRGARPHGLDVWLPMNYFPSAYRSRDSINLYLYGVQQSN